jgi:hypothetical protein
MNANKTGIINSTSSRVLAMEDEKRKGNKEFRCNKRYINTHPFGSFINGKPEIE